MDRKTKREKYLTINICKCIFCRFSDAIVTNCQFRIFIDYFKERKHYKEEKIVRIYYIFACITTQKRCIEIFCFVQL